MKKLIDVSKMEVLSSHEEHDELRQYFLERRTDNDRAVVEHQVFQITSFKKGTREIEEVRQYRSKQKLSKMLCIGGPNAGRVLASPGENYLAYNAAGFNRGRDKDTRSRCLWIHDSLVFPMENVN
jgi:hypothetical protein